MPARKLIFLATEDWFIRSHFMPLVRRARADGFEVAVAARESSALQDLGVRVIAMPFARSNKSPGAIFAEANAVRDMLKAEQPAILHVFGLKPIVVALAAGQHGAARALALTGRGYLSVSSSWLRYAAPVLAQWIRSKAKEPGNALVLENAADLAWVEGGDPLPADHVAIMPGAGVDPDAFAPRPEPIAPPLVVGAAARLIWSKGFDVAVAALQRLRFEGRNVELHIAGEIDPENPEAVSEATLAQWRAIEGVRLLGKVSDIAGFWSRTHVACFPTRGGEGLPRALLEAASCGRALVVTNTPGCSDFVRDEVDGLLVAPDDARALARGIERLVDDAELRRRLGENARARVLAGFTEAHAADVASSVWRKLAPA